jgi:hypothetical protein
MQPSGINANPLGRRRSTGVERKLDFESGRSVDDDSKRTSGPCRLTAGNSQAMHPNSTDNENLVEVVSLPFRFGLPDVTIALADVCC